MPKTLDARKAIRLTEIVRQLSGTASFRSILREGARASIVKDNETLRVYLDFLVAGNVLTVRTRDVGSVRLQQLYSVKSQRPKVSVGLRVLRSHGLNWDVPETEERTVRTDFEGLARSKIVDSTLIASLEDCLVHELCMDARRGTGTTTFVVAMLSTKRLDIAYLLRRADEVHVGRAVRLLFNRILETTSSRETDTPASVFFAVRARFLKIARQYSQSGLWRLVDGRGVGDLGVSIVKNLTEHDIVVAAGKQLGVTG